MTATTPRLRDKSCFSSNVFMFCLIHCFSTHSQSYEMCLNLNSMTWHHIALVMGWWGDMLRVLVPLAFKVLILILISVHDLFNIGQNSFFFSQESLSSKISVFQILAFFSLVRLTGLTQINSVCFHCELAGTKQNSPLLIHTKNHF